MKTRLYEFQLDKLHLKWSEKQFIVSTSYYYTTVTCFPLYVSGNTVKLCAGVVGEEPRIGCGWEQSNSLTTEIHKHHENHPFHAPKLPVKCLPSHHGLRQYVPSPCLLSEKSLCRPTEKCAISLPFSQYKWPTKQKPSRHGPLLHFLNQNKINNPECLAGSQRPLRFNSSSSAWVNYSERHVKQEFFVFAVK